ncbi:NACHT domain-containing protein [Lyngbya confervoides]|uniref:NACHT domain-containing protein n=1 Tax=Lyngbya confervoides BDU141951 TaxID=1574623 RepID=A0ABD4T402_9CYAN|nr:NACHT domain-containing protein [Lyngbya confervoides]MCM1983541.1 NACHT domain-containing protein [Lyngbya confervoides BDU141951]
MAKRSLKASITGRALAKQAFERTSWTQEYLAYQVGLETRQSVWKFFSGRAVDRHIFMELCFQLNLDWTDIAEQEDPPPAAPDQPATTVAQIKQQLQAAVQDQWTPLLSPFTAHQPLSVQALYTPLHILPTLTHERWLEIADLSAQARGQESLTSWPALQSVSTHSKLVLLGKPGAGKTTFLQYLAIACLENHLFPEFIPVLIALRSVGTDHPSDGGFSSLAELIQRQGGWRDIPMEAIESALQTGRMLLLFDGLDEVPDGIQSPLTLALQQWFSSYGGNRMVVTARISSQRPLFQGFTYVELADFSRPQIEQFTRQFFNAVAPPPQRGSVLAQHCLEQLYRKSNQPLLGLTSTPILLTLICSIFLERRSLPSHRAKLYQYALEIFLSRWDQARGIDRSGLALAPGDLLGILTLIAANLSEREKIYVERADLVQLVRQALQTVFGEANQPAGTEVLQGQAEQMLQQIVSQQGLLVEHARGIFAFSHLTFQEYLTARHMAAGPPDRLSQLLHHMTDPHWHEVILLTSHLLAEETAFLQQMCDHLRVWIGAHPRICNYLAMIHGRVQALEGPYPVWALRAFYFSILCPIENLGHLPLPTFLSGQAATDLALDLALIRLVQKIEQVVASYSIQGLLEIYVALNFEQIFRLDRSFLRDLAFLKAKLPDYAHGRTVQLDWWQRNGAIWLKDWYELLKQHRGLVVNWHWSGAETAILHQYFYGNQLLVESLNAAPHLTQHQRQSLMGQLFLPQDHSQLVTDAADYARVY